MHRRIARLNYAIEYPSETVSVSPAAEPVDVQLGEFSCRVTAEQLVATPAGDFETVQDARILLEPHLEAWSASTELFDRCPMNLRTWTEDAGWSPNRPDALTWVATKAMLEPQTESGFFWGD